MFCSETWSKLTVFSLVETKWFICLRQNRTQERLRCCQCLSSLQWQELMGWKCVQMITVGEPGLWWRERWKKTPLRLLPVWPEGKRCHASSMVTRLAPALAKENISQLFVSTGPCSCWLLPSLLLKKEEIPKSCSHNSQLCPTNGETKLK